MNATQLRDFLRLLDAADEALQEIEFTWWQAETVWPATVNRWIREAGR